MGRRWDCAMNGAPGKEKQIPPLRYGMTIRVDALRNDKVVKGVG
jgi:hypothetical protein